MYLQPENETGFLNLNLDLITHDAMMHTQMEN